MENSIPAMFFTRVVIHAQRVCLHEKREGAYQGTTWTRLYSEVQNFALGLMDLGVAEGDRVALMCSTKKAWVVADLAILSCAAVNVPIYHTNKQKQIRHILADSRANVLVLGEKDSLDEIIAVWDSLPDLKTVILLEGDPGIHENIFTVQQVMEKGAGALSMLESTWRSRWEALTPADLASIIYTSGTTGDPKGVMLTHGNFLSDVEACDHAVKVYPTDIALSFLPLSHVFERTAGYYLMLYSGAAIAYAESVDTLATNLQEVRPTIMFSVPRVFEKLFVRIHDNGTQGSYLKKRIFFWALAVGKKWHLEKKRSNFLKI